MATAPGLGSLCGTGSGSGAPRGGVRGWDGRAGPVPATITGSGAGEPRRCLTAALARHRERRRPARPVPRPGLTAWSRAGSTAAPGPPPLPEPGYKTGRCGSGGCARGGDRAPSGAVPAPVPVRARCRCRSLAGGGAQAVPPLFRCRSGPGPANGQRRPVAQPRRPRDGPATRAGGGTGGPGPAAPRGRHRYRAGGAFRAWAASRGAQGTGDTLTGVRGRGVLPTRGGRGAPRAGPWGAGAVGSQGAGGERTPDCGDAGGPHHGVRGCPQRGVQEAQGCPQPGGRACGGAGVPASRVAGVPPPPRFSPSPVSRFALTLGKAPARPIYGSSEPNPRCPQYG